MVTGENLQCNGASFLLIILLLGTALPMYLHPLWLQEVENNYIKYARFQRLPLFMFCMFVYLLPFFMLYRCGCGYA